MSGLARKHCAAGTPPDQHHSRTRKDDARRPDDNPTPPPKIESAPRAARSLAGRADNARESPTSLEVKCEPGGRPERLHRPGHGPPRPHVRQHHDRGQWRPNLAAHRHGRRGGPERLLGQQRLHLEQHRQHRDSAQRLRHDARHLLVEVQDEPHLGRPLSRTGRRGALLTPAARRLGAPAIRQRRWPRAAAPGRCSRPRPGPAPCSARRPGAPPG